MKTVKSLWESFHNEVVPRDAPLTQLVEVRRAFYAGAASMWGIITGGVSNPEDFTTLMKELDEFFIEEEKTGFGRPDGLFGKPQP